MFEGFKTRCACGKKIIRRVVSRGIPRCLECRNDMKRKRTKSKYQPKKPVHKETGFYLWYCFSMDVPVYPVEPATKLVFVVFTHLIFRSDRGYHPAHHWDWVSKNNLLYGKFCKKVTGSSSWILYRMWRGPVEDWRTEDDNNRDTGECSYEFKRQLS